MAFASKLISIVAAGILTLAWIFYVAANAVPQWNKVSRGEFHASDGLWRTCTTELGQTHCRDYSCSTNDSLCGKILAARTFVTIACIFSILAAIFLFISLVTSDRLRSMLLLAGKMFAWICLVVGIIGVAIGIDTLTRTRGVRIPWGAGSIIGVIALVVNAVGAVISLLAK